MSSTKTALFFCLIILLCCQTSATTAGSTEEASDGRSTKGTDFANLKRHSQNEWITKSMKILCADAKKHRANIWTLDIDSNTTLRIRVQQYFDSLSRDSQGFQQENKDKSETKTSSEHRSADSIWLRVSLVHFASEPAIIRVEELLEKANASSTEGTRAAKVGYFMRPEKSKSLERIESVSKPIYDTQQQFDSVVQPNTRRIDPKNTGDFYPEF